MIYFSYGSNMSARRLGLRISEVEKIGIATLCGHDLRFHKVSKKDGTGKCDIFKTNDPNHFVMGVLYEINPSEKSKLDKYEGLGYGYDEKRINLEIDGKPISAFTYYATNIDPSLIPLNWYKEHVIRGARENGLPEEYVLKILAVESIEDQDVERRAQELAIYD